MREKFELINLNTKTVKRYKSLRQLQKDFPDYTYHQLYQVFLQTMKLTERKQQPHNVIAKLYSQIRIYEIPPPEIKI